MVVHSVGVRLSDRSAASHVPLSKDGVAFRLTAVWNCVLEPWDGISPADPKGIFAEVYHTSRIIHERSNCEAVKPVKRQTQRRLSCTHSHSFAVCGTHNASFGYWPDWLLLIRRKKKGGDQDTAEAVVVQSLYIFLEKG